MSDSMSTPATHAIEAEVDAAPAAAGPSSMGDAAAGLSLEDAFDVERTAQIVLEGGYKTIGLQFPDELLPSSVAVYRAIQARIASSGAQAYVLADSTYGACCPDVLSCLHLPADLLVHYGHACLTPTDALPVHYVFPRFHLDATAACDALKEATEWEGKEGVVVVWDVAYDWLESEIVQAFSADRVGKPVSFARITRPEVKGKQVEGAEAAVEGVEAAGAVPSAAASACCGGSQARSCCQDNASSCSNTNTDTTSSCCKSTPASASACTSGSCSTAPPPRPTSSCAPAPALRAIAPPPGVDLSTCALWYLGSDGRSLLNVQMTHATADMYAYDPSAGARTCTGASRLLARRLFAVHQALAADVFGLVVGNVGLASSKPLLARLRAQLAAKGKKSYTLSVGRLNPAKLANFADIECFVLVGCAEGGVVDSKDFLRPIVTPYELTLALSGAEWDPAKWTLDLGRVLASTEDEADKAKDKAEEDAAASDEELEFSLVTGTYRTRKVFGASTSSGGATAGAVEGVDAATQGVQDLTLRASDFTIAKLESAGSMFLESRSFRGLEPRYGLDEPAVLEQGRSGIARGYTEEK